MAANPSRIESDSENDLDYVPPNADEEPSSSESEPESKRARAESPKLSPDEEEARKNHDFRALWTSFQASVHEIPSTSTQVAVPQRMIKVQKRYRFAGEEVTEVIEVPEDSPEAKKWPTWRPAEALQVSASTSSVVSSVVEKNPIPTSPQETGTPTPPNGRRPGPRKPKTQLTELPGRGTPRAKKLTTLDKSVMDWKAHVQSSDDIELQDELEANRRGGGFLGKVEFLQRVEERKDAVFEAAKGNKRRRT
ncbi:hypothetical protein APHAL10511_006961 [Amanita phalloides]|nr:hypothetical protein APHAL10511_006961 [Amanita phalloides]